MENLPNFYQDPWNEDTSLHFLSQDRCQGFHYRLEISQPPISGGLNFTVPVTSCPVMALSRPRGEQEKTRSVPPPWNSWLGSDPVPVVQQEWEGTRCVAISTWGDIQLGSSMDTDESGHVCVLQSGHLTNQDTALFNQDTSLIMTLHSSITNQDTSLIGTLHFSIKTLH